MSGRESQARQRLIDSFWELLEDLPFRKITVGKLVERADCNRATFYYHYQDMEDLLLRALDQEFAKSGGIASATHRFVVSGQLFLNDAEGIAGLCRFALAARRVGFDVFSSQCRTLIGATWRTVLCSRGQELSVDAQMIVDTLSDGITGWLIHGSTDTTEAFTSFARDLTRLECSHLASLYGLTLEEVLARLEMTGQLRSSCL